MIRQIRWQLLLVTLGIILLAALLIQVAVGFTTVWVPTSGGTYIEGLVGSPQYINPLFSQFNPVDRDLCSLIFNGLTRMGTSGRVEPDLAERWAVSPDGLIYTFTLDPRVRWHDGTYLSAKDVLLTIELLQDPEYPGPADLAILWRSVQVTRVNRRTVQFTLEQPYAPFLDYTTIGILPSHILKDVQAADLPQHEFNLQPVGTGRFRMPENSLNFQDEKIASLTLNHNPYYPGDEPMLDHLQFNFYPDSSSAYNAYLEGEIQGIGHVTLDILPGARLNPDLNLFTSPLPEYTLIFLNLNNPDVPFLAETEIRQALMYALDRQAIIDTALEGQGIVAQNPVLPGTWAYTQTLHYDYDPLKAASLLDQAGWRIPGTGASISTTLPATATFGVRRQVGKRLAFNLLVYDDPIKVAVAQETARQWRRIGVDVSVQPVSSGLVSQYLEPRRFQAAMVDLTMLGDPDPYPFWQETQVEPPGQNYAGYIDREFSELLERARQTVDDDQRALQYHRFQQIFAERALAILLYQPTYTCGVDRHIYQVQMGLLVQPGDRFMNVEQWYMRFKRVIQNVGQDQEQDPIGPLGTLEP